MANHVSSTNRRSFLAALATAPVAALPAVAGDDPDTELLATMEEWRANQRVWEEWEQVGYEPHDHGKALVGARVEIEERAFAIQPQTVAGLAGLAEIVRSYFGPELPGCDNWALHNLLDSVEAMADARVA